MSQVQTWDSLLHTTESMDLDHPSQDGGGVAGQPGLTTPPPSEAMARIATPTTAPATLGPLGSPPETPAIDIEEAHVSVMASEAEATPPGAPAPHQTPVRRQRANKKATRKGSAATAGGPDKVAEEAARPASTAGGGGAVAGSNRSSIVTRPSEMLMALTRSRSRDQPEPSAAAPPTSDATAEEDRAPMSEGYVRVDPPDAAGLPTAASAPAAAPRSTPPAAAGAFTHQSAGAAPHNTEPRAGGGAADAHQREGDAARQDGADQPDGRTEPPPPPPPPSPHSAAQQPAGAQPPPPPAAAAAQPPPVGVAAGGVEPPAAGPNAVWMQAMANLMAAARPPPQVMIPKCLLWPDIKKEGQFSATHKLDFATWRRQYEALTRQVPEQHRSSHLLSTAVAESVRRTVEAHYQAQGLVAVDRPYVEICALIAQIYDPPDVVYRRVSAFLRLTQADRRLEDYLRERTQHRNQLVADGVVIDDHVERTLLVNTVSQRLREKILEKTDWWQRTTEEIADLLRAHQKAADSVRNQPGQSSRPNNYRPQRPLNAAVGTNRPATHGARAAPVSGRELLAAAMQSRRGTLSTQDMRQYYTDDQWSKRVGENGRPNPTSDPRRAENAHLYNRDKNPTTGRPYCVNCRKDGHTLDQCTALVKKMQQRQERGSKRGSGGGKGKGGANKRRRE